MDFPERLLTLMKEKGYTRYRLAKELDMSASTISNYLEKKTKPDSTKLELISRLLGVNRRWLLTGEGEKEREEVVNRMSDAQASQESIETVNRLLAIIEKNISSTMEKDHQIAQLTNTTEMLVKKIIPILDRMNKKMN